MELSELNLPEYAISHLKEKGILKLNPPQEKAIKAGLLDGNNLIVCSPTGSGKTLIATLGITAALSKKRGKALYIVPLKALASEKLKEYNSFFEKSNLRVAAVTSDIDSDSRWISSFDIIILTVEKLDSLIRHNAEWIPDTRIIIADEIHLINDPSRGPTLEVVLTLLRKLCPHAQLLGLSATIGNPEELSSWLNAKLVKDNYRPVKLYQGILNNEKADFLGKHENILLNEGEAIIEAAKHIVNSQKQALVFTKTKKEAEALAERISEDLPYSVNEIAKSLGNAADSPTSQCKRLAKIAEKPVAFHHSGLLPNQKDIIENSFRKGLIKIICCTPTLAMGMDLPCDYVIVKDLKRYGRHGLDWIPVLEYQQFIGRAGRPSYSDKGFSLALARNEAEQSTILSKYINGDPEAIASKLVSEPALRMHILSLIATGITMNMESLNSFFSSTLLGYQEKGMGFGLNIMISKIIDELKSWEFITKTNDHLNPTLLGKRVAQLYIDPLTASTFCEATKAKGSRDDFAILHLISSANELGSVTVGVREFDEYESMALKLQDKLLIEPEDDFDSFVAALKMAAAFNSHINEAGENFMMEKYNIRPGEFHTKKEMAEWLLYSLSEICGILNKNELKKQSSNLALRMDYGIKEELLPLVKLKNIGRVRARKLFSNNLKSIADIKKAGMYNVAIILGNETAKSVFSQIE